MFLVVCCSEYVECFHGMASKFFFKSFVAVLVAPVITTIIIHFMFHIHFISINSCITATAAAAAAAAATTTTTYMILYVFWPL